jgi:hypothetical protein
VTTQAETPRRPADAATERAVILGKARGYLDAAHMASGYGEALTTFATFVEWLRQRHSGEDTR